MTHKGAPCACHTIRVNGVPIEGFALQVVFVVEAGRVHLEADLVCSHALVAAGFDRELRGKEGEAEGL